jgi:hypothetical protein
MLRYNSIFSDKFFEERKPEIFSFLAAIPNFDTKIADLLAWYKELQSGKVAKRTEEQQKNEFIDTIFSKVLGYEGNENEWKVEKEFSFENGAVADALLGFFGVQKTSHIAVAIEIKKLKINLDKPQMQRADHFTPVEQGFHYAYQAADTCKWIIVSNFEEIRLYHHTDKNRYESFLFVELLQEKANVEKVEIKVKDKKTASQFVEYIASRFPNLPKFFYLLYFGQLFNRLEQTDAGAAPTTNKLYAHRIKRLEDITIAFYEKYKKYRKKLYEHIKSENKALELPDNQCLNLANKIFDRLIFMRFAEEVELISKKYLGEYLHYVRNIPTDDAIAWTSIQSYFKSFDKGHRNQIPPFNGELFKPIPILQEITVQNETIIEIMLFLASYDFKNELKVDILGHIFEQSLNDSTQANEEGIELRSKDGIFYTPEYITDFIIQETVGAWLYEQKLLIYKQLDIDFVSEFEIDLQRWESNLAIGQNGIRQKAIEIHTNFFTAYKKVLQGIKILDPACGSGAFLTRVFDYLLAENELVFRELDKLANNLYEELLPAIPQKEPKQDKQSKNSKQKAQAKQDMFEAAETQQNKYQKQVSMLGKEILLNNLYGVDLNYESTEITKLSLWLKTANKYGVTLANLSDNIKIGNSLVADKNIDQKAFEWQGFGGKAENKATNTGLEAENLEVFDVIVGNPPYFSLSTQSEEYANYYENHYKVFEKTSDIYCLFFEKALQLLKPNGMLGYITSNQWLQTNYGKILRNYLIEKANPKLLVNFGGVKVFRDATVDSSILVLKNENCDFNLRACKIPNNFKVVIDNLKKYVENNELLLTNLQADRWVIADDKTLKVKEKIKKAGSFLKDWNVTINYGIKTGLNEAFIVDEATKDRLVGADLESAELFVPLLRGRDVHQYEAKWAGLYLILAKNGVNIAQDYPNIYKYLESFGESIKNRSDQGENWWNLRACAYYDSFLEPKIIYPETTVRRSEFYLDKQMQYIDKTCFMITGQHLEFLTGILSSRLMEWYLETELRALGKNSIQYSKQYMENVPLPAFEDIDKKLYKKIVKLVENLHSAKKQLVYHSSTENFAIFEELKAALDTEICKLYGVSEEF